MERIIAEGSSKLNLLSGKHEITGSCRVCMAQSTNMTDIFDVASNIIDRIEFCTGLKLSEQKGLPSQICEACHSDLSIAHKFKARCLSTDEALQKLAQTVKEELNDDDASYCFLSSDDDVNEELYVDVKQAVVAKKKKSKSKPQIKESVRKKADSSQTPKEKPDPLYCKDCDETFKTKKQKEDHNRKLHKDAMETFVCEICGKVFIHRSSLLSHIRSHLPPQFACSMCDYATWHKHSLAQHILIHNGTKRFQCEYCKASYYTSSNLSSHIRRLHERLKPFSCHLCDSKFYDRTKLNRHLDSHNDVKRFECEVCHSCYTRRCYWKKHLQSQHNISVPAQRPGRRDINLLVGQSLVNQVSKKTNEVQN